METRWLDIAGSGRVRVLTLRAAVVGTGCAGYAAADRLWELGCRELAVLTEAVAAGTSRNAGSDKQTYYKLSLAGGEGDSVWELARTLYDGGGVDGDVALAQAAGSVRCFMKLAELGVPFPTNEYGEYVGYRTDHDTRLRGTSAGPLTSRYMTERLEEAVRAKGIPVLAGLRFIEPLLAEGRVAGALFLDERGGAAEEALVLVQCESLILATGGPALVYGDSVFPESQTGGTGALLAAGVRMANLQDWQYGLASIAFRWNVSGTYQQVLPRYIAQDGRGGEREFLAEAYPRPEVALAEVFRKGYEWPFDAAKLGGSSRVDRLVHEQTHGAGRRVFLDYRRDPAGFNPARLDKEAAQYLRRSGAEMAGPLNRLLRMNPGAVELYRNHGIDLAREPLEIGVCAQHCNGGAAVDAHWQTNIPGLYVVGEAAGTFGPYRPGGSALNATQVGAMRAAERAAAQRAGTAVPPEMLAMQLGWTGWRGPGEPERAREAWAALRREMSGCAAHLRRPERFGMLDGEIGRALDWARIPRGLGATEAAEVLRCRDALLAQRGMLSAMALAAERLGSRGSGAVLGPDGAVAPEAADARRQLVETEMTGLCCRSWLREVRPLPQPDNWFERVWEAYRARNGA